MLSEYLTAIELRQISAAAQVVKYPAQTKIISKGEVGSTFYVIKQGTVLCTEIGAQTHFPDIELKEGRCVPVETALHTLMKSKHTKKAFWC